MGKTEVAALGEAVRFCRASLHGWGGIWGRDPVTVLSPTQIPAAGTM